MMKQRLFHHTLFSVGLTVGAGWYAAQAQNNPNTLSGQTLRTVNTAVPFLNFTPDARSGAMGEAGVALRDADASAIFWNPSRLVFAEKDMGAVVSYTPWLRHIVSDMYYTNLAGYKKLGKNQVIGVSLMYFDLGTIFFTTDRGLDAGQFNSREYAATVSYSRRLSKNTALGVNLKYLNSNLGGSQYVNGLSIRPGATAAADIGIYHQNETIDPETGRGLGFSWGAMISNLGGRINYGSAERYFIPTNLRLGAGVTYYMDKRSKFNFVLDLNKLMVPTPPEYGTPINGVAPIVRGKDPNRPYIGAVFGSFADAPGGFSEELKEINFSPGVEYWYNDQFAVRGGYYYESASKGGRRYVTTGLGLRLPSLGVDLSYLIPTTADSPLSQTFRLSLLFSANAQPKGRAIPTER